MFGKTSICNILKAILILLFRSGTSVSTFISFFPRRNTFPRTLIIKHVEHKDAEETSWEQHTRDEAATALLPVLFPRRDSNGLVTQNPVTAEAALKKLLRSKYKATTTNTSQINTKSTAAVDSRLSATLVLGTSVMRLRHWYVVANKQADFFTAGYVPPIPYPFNSSILSLAPFDSHNITESNGNHSTAELLSFTKAMVEEHINYLSNPRFSSSLKRISANNNPAIQLSLLYSVPTYLAESLLKHYGYTITDEILVQSNAPGPITVRKNSIRFPGSDKQFCQLLMDEDGVRAVPLRSSENDESFSQSKLAINISADGCNLFTVGSESKPGLIRAPSGCIRVFETKEPQSNVPTKKLSKSIWSMRSWQQGNFEVQDAGSQVIVHSLEAKPGDSVLDYCAGNGGKTFGVASVLMETRRSRQLSTENYRDPNIVSKIIAHDVVDERLRQIKGSMCRVGFTEENNPHDPQQTSSSPVFYTAYTDQGSCQIGIATTTELQSMKVSKFDIVLVDAPCSSTGVLRRRPSQRWSLTEEEVFDTLPQLQLKILKDAAKFVKKGGRLVYSTCSLIKEENECIVSAFEQSDVFQNSFQRWEFDADESAASTKHKMTRRNTLTILPSSNSDGFFIARWKAI